MSDASEPAITEVSEAVAEARVRELELKLAEAKTRIEAATEVARGHVRRYGHLGHDDYLASDMLDALGVALDPILRGRT